VLTGQTGLNWLIAFKGCKFQVLPIHPPPPSRQLLKFYGEDNRTTWEHVSQYLAQLDEVGSVDALKVCLFFFVANRHRFSWFSSLLHNSIDSWEQLELKLSDLTSIRERDMADLAFNGLCSYLREKLDDHTFITLSQLQQNASAQESRSKENKDNFKHTRRNVNYVDCDFDRSSDKSNDVYAAEFCWPSKAKPYACDSLKPVHKNRQKEIKFTFDVAKCDKIFDELDKAGSIKMSYTIPPLDELKRKAYCRWHNSFSHATNDCNVFRRQVQSAINEGQLSLKKMQVDKNPFSVSTIDLQNSKVSIRPE
jgi:hypothetical protein